VSTMFPLSPPPTDPPPGGAADPDAAAMHRLGAGDPEALQELLDRHWRELLRYALVLGSDPDRGEDLAQEAFLGLWERRREWTGRGTVRAFLFRVVRNNALKDARRQEVRERLGGGAARALHRPPPSPHERYLEERMLDALEEGLRALPPRRREVIVLARFHGFSYGEIAETLGISSQTVANHLHLALRDLREHLEELEEGGPPWPVVRAGAGGGIPAHS